MSPDSRQAQNGESATDVALRAAHELETLLQREHHQIAALILEPLVQCAGQMAIHSPQYLQRARALCDQYGVHLIADEIAVGCGRTGRFFACEHAGIWPDFITLSKGISGGYLPLSLCLTTDAIYQAFYSDDTARGFLHSHSYTGNPLACAAALACLDLFETERVLDRNLQRAHDLTTAFAWAKADTRIEHVRQQGMILAFDVVHNALSKPGTFARDVFARGIEKGVLVRPIGSTVYVMPPYILSADETMAMGERIQRVVEDVLHAQKP
jgi:adenosylmethionine-8-amino-7-oxononanoate aminotransferase